MSYPARAEGLGKYDKITNTNCILENIFLELLIRQRPEYILYVLLSGEFASKKIKYQILWTQISIIWRKAEFETSMLKKQ